MYSTCFNVTIVQIFISLLMSGASFKYRMDTMMIVSVTKYNVISILVLNALLIRVRGIRLGILVLEIDNDIPILTI